MDKGDFKVVYYPTENKNYVQLEKAFKESGFFEIIADDLNNRIALPYDVSIVLGECGEANAFYYNESKQIIMCYELTDAIALSFYDNAETNEELATMIFQTDLFIFYHELGHALIDIYKLNTTGKEEDAVDQLSAKLLVEVGEEDAIRTSAYWFIENSKNNRLNKASYADVHAFDKQRAYNLLCYIYGKDPEKYSYLIGKKKYQLPQERAGGCEAEYSKMNSSWNSLLSHYLKSAQ